MAHVALLGDSIFDNARYVEGGPAVIDQLRSALPDWSVTLAAVDGATTSGVSWQLSSMPAAVTHLVVSVGGNDALRHTGIFNAPYRTSMEVFENLAQIQAGFQGQYRQMLDLVLKKRKATFVCTIYDGVPVLPPAAKTALSVFNDVILREASVSGVSVLDLRRVCPDAADYAAVSPIEPSVQGGEKITRLIAKLLKSHDFSIRNTVIYP